ncbi:FG-GAP-like repeat-containing protein [Streptomyces canus]|uniref:FG-GAP repeat protein n=1 Tax=Streptomyces canus TaxID=58343 RepID=UPI0022579F9A|nr:FG-GAP repeat protein [Streptomyces canus]MCX5255813.1 FG-GAP-like repeat-containing protein [Streptomyces canus]
MRRWSAAALVAARMTVGALLPATPAAAVHGGVPGDFNGDGYKDAVLPAPGADVSGKEGAGAVVVLYGSKSGLSAGNRKTITQNTSGVPGTAEKWDAFGATTSTADLNRDGYADLVVGTPDEDTPYGADAGVVTVLWGSKGGLTSGTDLPSPDRYSYRYGQDIAALGIGGGGRTRVSVASYTGSVHFTGPFTRGGGFGGVTLDMNTGSVLSVALGDFDGDTWPTPAVVSVRDGDLTGGRVYTTLAVDKELQGNGLVAAGGDLNGDGYTDLVTGDPDEPEKAGVDGESGGRVLVWYGSAAGISADTAPVQITQNTAGVPGASESGDAFGGALAVADLNRDGLADIVVGAPYENLAKNRAGQVTVIPGRASGALGTGSYSFSQDAAGVPGASETDDFFATTVSVGDVNKDGRPELFVGASGENNYTGAVWVFPGGSTLPTATGSKLFTAASVGLTQGNGTLLGGNGLLWVI